MGIERIRTLRASSGRGTPFPGRKLDFLDGNRHFQAGNWISWTGNAISGQEIGFPGRESPFPDRKLDFLDGERHFQAGN